MLSKYLKINELYDLYGVLLTERQRRTIELYYHEDWSFTEIAQELKISRQAVNDTLKRAVEALDKYEAALHLSQKEREATATLSRLKQLLEDEDIAAAQELLTMLLA